MAKARMLAVKNFIFANLGMDCVICVFGIARKFLTGMHDAFSEGFNIVSCDAKLYVEDTISVSGFGAVKMAQNYKPVFAKLSSSEHIENWIIWNSNSAL